MIVVDVQVRKGYMVALPSQIDAVSAALVDLQALNRDICTPVDPEYMAML